MGIADNKFRLVHKIGLNLHIWCKHYFKGSINLKINSFNYWESVGF